VGKGDDMCILKLDHDFDNNDMLCVLDVVARMRRLISGLFWGRRREAMTRHIFKKKRVMFANFMVSRDIE
jgi:hypothetical protein